MALGGFCKLPSGAVVVALTLPSPVARDAAGGAAGDGAAGQAGGGVPFGDRGGAVRVPLGERGGAVRVVVHAANRSRALTRLRNLGLRSIYLRGNTHPPTPDEVTAVLHHPDGLIWRTAPPQPGELWHPIRSLLGAAEPAVPAAVPTAVGGPAGSSAGSLPLAGLAEPRLRRMPEPPLTVPEAWTATEA